MPELKATAVPKATAYRSKAMDVAKGKVEWKPIPA